MVSNIIIAILQLYGFKYYYSYIIVILQLYGFKDSNPICKKLYDFKQFIIIKILSKQL